MFFVVFQRPVTTKFTKLFSQGAQSENNLREFSMPFVVKTTRNSPSFLVAF